MDPLPEYVGSWRPLRYLASGSRGKVYLAERGGQLAAVKVFRAEVVADRQFHAGLQREVRLARSVASICVAHVLDADTDAEQPWVAFEYIPGPYLTDRAPLPTSAVRVLAVGLAEALMGVHAAGLIYRWLKPADVVLGPAGPRMLSIGGARGITELSPIGSDFVGNPAWISPEQFNGSAASAATDVFRWGLIVAHASHGRMPYGVDYNAAMQRIVRVEPDLAGLDPSLAPALTSALNPNPALRPSTRGLIDMLLGPVPDIKRAITDLIARDWRLDP